MAPVLLERFMQLFLYCMWLCIRIIFKIKTRKITPPRYKIVIFITTYTVNSLLKVRRMRHYEFTIVIELWLTIQTTFIWPECIDYEFKLYRCLFIGVVNESSLVEEKVVSVIMWNQFYLVHYRIYAFTCLIGLIKKHHILVHTGAICFCKDILFCPDVIK